MNKGILAILSFLIILPLVGCGSESADGGGRIITPTYSKPLNWMLHAFDPLEYHYDTRFDDPYTLIPVERDMILQQYQAIVEPELNNTRTHALSVITGIGMSAKDSTGKDMVISLAIEARQYNPETHWFSSTSRIFAPQAQNLEGAQVWVLKNTNPNYLLTGLGFSLKHGTLTSLQLQRKTIAELGDAGAQFSGAVKVELPPGWAAIGVIVKFRPQGTITMDTKIPFASDTMIYTSLLTQE